MNVIIKAHHVEITDALKEYAEKKIDKVNHFFDQIQHVTINLDIEGLHSNDQNQVASAVIKSSGRSKVSFGILFSIVNVKKHWVKTALLPNPVCEYSHLHCLF